MKLWLTGNRPVLFSAIMILAVLFFTAGLNNRLPLQEDSAIYVILGNSLIHGSGYTHTAGPANTPGNYYPFVYPFMLAPLLYLFPQNFLALKLLSVLIAILFLIVFFIQIKRFFKNESSFWVMPLLALNPQMAHYSGQILTEIPYIFFSILALYLADRYKEKIGVNNRYLYFSVIAVYTAYYTRSIGVCLFVSIAGYFLLKNDFRKAAAYFCFFLSIIFLWITHNFIFVDRSAYTVEFFGATGNLLQYVHRWLYNLVATVGKELPDLFFYPWLVNIDPYSVEFIPKFILGCIIALLLVRGFVLKLKQEGLNLADTYVIAYFFLMYLSWTHHGARYLLPLMPFLLYYLIVAIKDAAKNRKLFYTVIFLVILLGCAGNIKEIIKQRNDPFTPAEKSFVAGVDWMKANVPKESIIVSRRPNWVYVYSNGYRGLKFITTKDTKRQFDHIISRRVDYIIIDRNKIYRDDARDYLLPLVEKYKDRFEKVYAGVQEPHTYIYRVKR